MRWILFAFAAVAFAAFREPLTTSRVGSVSTCVSGQKYVLSYSTEGLTDDAFVDLDTVKGLTGVQCDIDQTRFLLNFDTADHQTQFANSLTQYTSFVTSTGNFAGCLANGDVLLHRVTGFNPVNTRQAELLTVPAKYDEVLKDANMTLTRSGSCGNDQICLGVNTNDCRNPATTIPLYKNDYLDLTCQDCFLGAHAEVFFTLQITLWKLTHVAGGLRNIAIEGALVLDLESQARWSAGVDKTYSLVGPTVVMNFKIGVIPVRIWFEIPVQVKVNAMFAEQASAQAGAKINYVIGDWNVDWTPQNHWVVAKPSPKFSYQPVLTGSANIRGRVDAAIIPTFKMHVDNLADFDLTLDPTLHLALLGTSQAQQVCADLTYDAIISTRTALKIDINWLNIHVDKEWNAEIMNTGIQPIGRKCLP